MQKQALKIQLGLQYCNKLTPEGYLKRLPVMCDRNLSSPHYFKVFGSVHFPACGVLNGNSVLLKDIRWHYWQLTIAQDWATWAFGRKHDSHQNSGGSAFKQHAEMAAQISRVFWLCFTVGGSGKASFIFIYVKVWNGKKCFQPIQHSSMTNMNFCDTRRHAEAFHTFFSSILYKMHFYAQLDGS